MNLMNKQMIVVLKISKLMIIRYVDVIKQKNGHVIMVNVSNKLNFVMGFHNAQMILMRIRAYVAYNNLHTMIIKYVAVKIILNGNAKMESA